MLPTMKVKQSSIWKCVDFKKNENIPRSCQFAQHACANGMRFLLLHILIREHNYATKMFGDMLCYCGSWRKISPSATLNLLILMRRSFAHIRKVEISDSMITLHISANSYCKWIGDQTKIKVEIVGVVKEMSLSETWKHICLWGARSLRSLAHTSKLIISQVRNSV